MKQPWAPWMEKLLENLADSKIKKIAAVAISEDGDYYTSYYDCNPGDLFAMAGYIYSDGMWQQLEANGQKLKNIIMNGESEDAED